jgi:hypothetical protein
MIPLALRKPWCLPFDRYKNYVLITGAKQKAPESVAKGTGITAMQRERNSSKENYHMSNIALSPSLCNCFRSPMNCTPLQAA